MSDEVPKKEMVEFKKRRINKKQKTIEAMGLEWGYEL